MNFQNTIFITSGLNGYEKRFKMNGCIYRTADNQCEKFSDSVRNTLSWCVGDEPCEARKISNADCIRKMTDEELAEFLTNVSNNERAMAQSASGGIRIPWKDWLKMEAEDD